MKWGIRLAWVIWMIVLLVVVNLVSCTLPMIQHGETKLMLGNVGGELSIDSLEVGGIKITGYKNSNTEGLKAALEAVRKMWNSYLTLEGLKFISGKYYDHQGKIVDGDKAVKLEELRNARSVAEGQQKLQELEMMHAMGAVP